jgi:hypothetical protein
MENGENGGEPRRKKRTVAQTAKWAIPEKIKNKVKRV